MIVSVQMQKIWFFLAEDWQYRFLQRPIWRIWIIVESPAPFTEPGRFPKINVVLPY